MPREPRSFRVIFLLALTASALLTLLLRLVTPLPGEFLAVLSGLTTGVFVGVLYFRSARREG